MSRYLAIYSQVRPIIRAAKARGWSLAHRAKHPALVSPGGTVVVYSGSPKNADAAAKRLAADIARVERAEGATSAPQFSSADQASGADTQGEAK